MRCEWMIEWNEYYTAKVMSDTRSMIRYELVLLLLFVFFGFFIQTWGNKLKRQTAMSKLSTQSRIHVDVAAYQFLLY